MVPRVLPPLSWGRSIRVFSFSATKEAIILDFIRSLFSSRPGLDRISPAGIVLMVVGAAAALFAANALQKRDGRLTGRVIACKLGGLLLACIGALIAIR